MSLIKSSFLSPPPIAVVETTNSGRQSVTISATSSGLSRKSTRGENASQREDRQVYIDKLGDIREVGNDLCALFNTPIREKGRQGVGPAQEIRIGQPCLLKNKGGLIAGFRRRPHEIFPYIHTLAPRVMIFIKFNYPHFIRV